MYYHVQYVHSAVRAVNDEIFSSTTSQAPCSTYIASVFTENSFSPQHIAVFCTVCGKFEVAPPSTIKISLISAKIKFRVIVTAKLLSNTNWSHQYVYSQ